MEYALVAGGSKGIGYAIAEALAKRKYNLILIGRHETVLINAKNTLEAIYHVEVHTLTIDLSIAESAYEVADWCNKKGIILNVLCNVAGIGGAKDYLDSPLNDMRTMIHVNLESVMALTMQLLPLLRLHAPSYILNVASMAGFAPIPIKNLYSATKSAVIFFSYSLKYQLKDYNISVSCLCPGPVFTKPEIEQDTINKLGWFGRLMAVETSKVGEEAVRKTLSGTMIIIPGIVSKIISLFLRLFPARLLAFIYYKLGNKK